jgi:putative spermidine/putrescine transport system ATP-binding protein
LYDRPATTFVASFLGESNQFPARVVEAGAGQCLLNGGALRLRTMGNSALASGSRATVVVRPERMRVVAGGAGAGEENAVSGVLADLIYLGRARKYIVRLGSGQEVSAVEQAGGSAAPPSLGTTVQLRWLAEDALALPQDAGGG